MVKGRILSSNFIITTDRVTTVCLISNFCSIPQVKGFFEIGRLHGKIFKIGKPTRSGLRFE